MADFPFFRARWWRINALADEPWRAPAPGRCRHVLAHRRDCTSSRATSATRYGANPSSVSTRGTPASTDLFSRPEPFRLPESHPELQQSGPGSGPTSWVRSSTSGWRSAVSCSRSARVNILRSSPSEGILHAPLIATTPDHGCAEAGSPSVACWVCPAFRAASVGGPLLVIEPLM